MIDVRRHNPAWDILSFVLHALLFVVLVFCTPVREIVLPKREPSPPSVNEMAPEKLEKLDAQLAEARMRELERELEALQTILNNMDVVRDQLRQDFDDVVRDLAAEARETVRKAAQEARRIQEETLARQDRAAEAIDRLAEAEKGDLDQTGREIFDQGSHLFDHEFMEIADAQAKSQNALDRVQTLAAFSGFEKVAEAAAALRETQIAAARLQSAKAKSLVETTHPFWEFDFSAKRKASEEAQAEKDRKEEAVRSEQYEKALAEQEQAKQKRDEAEKRRAEAEKQQNKAEVKAARTERDRFENVRKTAERRANDAKSRMEHFAKHAADHARRAEAAQKRMDELKAAAAKIDTEAQKAAQATARKAQQDILDAMAKLDAAIEDDVAAPKSHVAPEAEANALSTRDTSRMSLSQAYKFARTLEEAVTESYREVVAASTALTQHLPLEEAERLTDVAKPVREDIDAALLDGRARTAEALAAQKEARYNAVREAENMVDASMSMMTEAFRLAGVGETEGKDAANHPRGLQRLQRGDLAEHGDTARTERFIALAGLSDQLESAAAENAGMMSKDLTALTALGAAAQSGEKPLEEESIREAGKSAEESKETPPEAKAGADGKPQRPGTGRDLLPGNIISLSESSNGRPGRWMYIMSWWVIGPFPNPDRSNLTRKFPPESVVDLDAAYEGEGGLVRWQFVQARNGSSTVNLFRRAEVSPPGFPQYTIWYGWTRLIVDQDCDVWLAAGSDDRSDIWVNGMKVWASGNNLKEWSINEGFRKIHLNKGANEILLRLENGHGPTGFSVCVSPNETPPPL